MHKFYSSAFILIFVFVTQIELAGAGTLSCSVKAASACNGVGETVIYRMSGADNAHAELPSQTTGVYADNVVCCTLGFEGLSNVCASPQATALNLTAVTNSHASQTATSPYLTPACISVQTGQTVSVGYQQTNCTGFDTILGSMSETTNAHVGNTTAYPTKICATATGGGAGDKAVTSILTSSIFDTGVAFGAAYNSIMWKGTLGEGNTGKVRFQFAASNSTTGPWNYYGGSTCGALDWFDIIAPDVAVELKGTSATTCQTEWNNKRYFRYRVQLCSGDCTTASKYTPTVTDIIVNWAP